MKKLYSLILCLGVLLLTASMLHAQDFSKYRGFSLGTSAATVLKHTEQKSADLNVTHEGPSLFQELTWWPPNIAGASYRPDSVEQILFSFHNGELYKISVTYDQPSTEGLTAEDIMKSISAKYGPATSVALEAEFTKNDRYELKERLVASWEDSQYSLNLVRSSFSGRFGLVIYSKRVNAEAELAIAESVKIANEEGPKREVERKKKEADDLETARQKNQKTFRP